MNGILPSNAKIEAAMGKYFPEPDFAISVHYDHASDCQLLQVLHRRAARYVTTALETSAFEDLRRHTDIFEGTMDNIQNTLYQDLASHGHGSSPFEPGNAHHEEIKALCYLSGYKLVEHMPAGAVIRGDAWIYLVYEDNGSRPLPQRTANKMPPQCLALPLDFWRQLLIKKLDKQVANKQAVI